MYKTVTGLPKLNTHAICISSSYDNRLILQTVKCNAICNDTSSINRELQLQLHEVARAISIYGDVVHYGYSMNWTTETFGSNILDYLMFDDYDTANDLINMALGEGYIAEKHGAAGRRRGSNSKPGNEISVQLVTVFERK